MKKLTERLYLITKSSARTAAVFLTATCCCLTVSVTALYAQDYSCRQVQNPILPYQYNYFLTDGEAHNFGGKIYTYQCWDANPGEGYASQFYMQMETDDMKQWTVRKILDSRDTVIPEEHRGKILWDCDGAYNKTTGKYLLYGFFDPDFNRFNNPMFVLESDKPSGTFTNFRYIVGDKSGEKIDGISAQVFTDDDGQRYITYGIPTPSSGNYHKVVIARLADDNVVAESSVTEITPSVRDFFENPSIRKRGDTYYFLYAENVGPVPQKDDPRESLTWAPKRLSYATSKNIFGPWTYRGVIISVEQMAGNTNIQGCIEQLNGQWYVFYHRILQGLPYKRAECVEKIFFDRDGFIIPVEPSSSGAGDGLKTSETIWFNSAVTGFNYKFSPAGKYGGVTFDSNAETGFRYVMFTGKEKSVAFHGEGLENIEYIKVCAGTKIIGNGKYDGGKITLHDVPEGKAELNIIITAKGEVRLETLNFEQVN